MIPIPEPAADSLTWPVVLAFAKLMEHKLALNRHKGDREGWLNDYAGALSKRISDEHYELDLALAQHILDSSGNPLSEAVALEAADVANFAMMVADRVTDGKLLNAPILEVSNNSQPAIDPREEALLEWMEAVNNRLQELARSLNRYEHQPFPTRLLESLEKYKKVRQP